MKTRFDVPGVWITACGEVLTLADMTTAHLINTARMLVTKPSRTMSILISDIEKAAFSDAVWTPFKADNKKQSIKNVTSMSAEALVEYVRGTPLFQSILAELTERGVDTDNLMSLFSDPNF